jgi:hypothetical protein
MPRRVFQKVLKIVLATLAVVIFGFSQKPATITQKTQDSTCSNIVALAGNASIKCSSLTPTQKKLIESIPALLNKIISNQLDPNLLIKKIDEMEASVKEIHEQQEMSGVLLPGNEPTPSSSCRKVPSDVMMLFLGNSVVFNKGFPHAVLTVHGQTVLSMRKLDKGITVSAKVFSADGRIIAEIKDNEFFINPNNIFRREFPDKSTLVVYDHLGGHPKPANDGHLKTGQRRHPPGH